MGFLPLQTSGLANSLLGDIARQVQLPPSDYRLAEQHHQALARHLERDGSPLKGLVVRVYAQGGVAIGAVVSSKFDRDEFDVDAIVELAISPTVAPAIVLDALFDALNGEPVSRYHGKVTRQTRCVTVDFDRMHVDLTPSVLMLGRPQRTSVIFHAHEDDAPDAHRRIVANPWGFANWFEECTPGARFFADSAMRKSADPLPDPKELEEKSLPLIALQLLKRWRNKCYDSRRNMRKPPSVILSYYVALHGGGRATLLEELIAQTRQMQEIFSAHDTLDKLIDVRNPRCPEDRFSDRWPATAHDQRCFTNDLHDLVANLAKLAASPSVEDMNRIFSTLFGERSTRVVFDELAKNYSAATFGPGLRQYLGSGAVALGPSVIGTAAAATTPWVASPRHTNFGSDGECDES